MKRYFGNWCAWCAMWVDNKDTEARDGQKFHLDCGNVVDRRSSLKPIVIEPPSPEVLEAHEAHRKMVAEFAQEAM